MKRFLNLRWKILYFFSFVVLFFGVTLGYSLYKSNEKLILKSIGSQAENISNRAVTYIDVDDYQKILKEIEAKPFSLKYSQNIVDSPEFRKMNKVLDNYRLSQGVKYVYTMAFLPNGKFVYVVDGYTILAKVTKGINDAGISPPGMSENDKDLINSAKKVYATKHVVVGELVQSDDWGALLSSYTPIKDKNGKVVGLLGADIDGKSIYKQLDSTKNNIILFTSIIMIFTILLSLIFSRMLTKPLSSFVTYVNRLKEGDFTAEFNLKSNDEFGVLSESLRLTTLELSKMIKIINETAENLTESSENLLGHSNDSSQQADASVEKIHQLKEKFEYQLNYVRDTVETFHNMIKSFETMNLKTNNVYKMSDSVTNTAKKGKEQMGRVISKMDNLLQFQNEYSIIINELTDKTKEIHQIVSTISEISSQTNLLALNASIEAARAGDQGKGFKVVADEVKKLANESSESVQHISNLISSIQTSVDKTISRIDETSEHIRLSSFDIKESGNSFLSIMDEIHDVNNVLKDMRGDSETLFQDTKDSISSIEEIMKLTNESSEIVHSFEEDLVEQQSKIRVLDKETVSLSNLSKVLHDLIRKFKIK